MARLTSILAPEADGEAAERLERRAVAAFDQVRGLHPGVALSAEDFFAFVAERLPAERDAVTVERLLARLNLGDLFLACGCLRGDNSACASFLRGCDRQLKGALRGLRQPDLTLREVQNLVFQRLFVPQGARVPKIAHYRGEGPLASWVKVVAVRLLLNRLRDHRRLELGAESLLERASRDEPADLSYMKRVYRGQFKRAFSQAVDELTPKQRNLLRYQLLDGMSAAEIGSIYRVHRATVHRWQQGIQEQLFARTRAFLQEQLDLPGEELASIVRLIQSHWEVSLNRILKDEASVDGEQRPGAAEDPDAEPV